MSPEFNDSLVIGGARSSDPETSHEAARGNEGVRSNQALLLLRTFSLYPDGLTAVEAGTLLGFDRPDRRVSDLFQLGLLALARDSDGRIITRTPFNTALRHARRGRVLVITRGGLARLAAEEGL